MNQDRDRNSQRVAVTGGSGLAGSFVVQALVEAGYEVLCLDRAAPAAPICPYKIADATDLGQMVTCLQGMDAVVHFAAIPRPTFEPADVVFRTNTQAMFAVLEAAALLQIKRIVYASSISVLGYPFYARFFEPEYAPIDEAHPRAPQDVYALSKHLGEEMAAAYARRTDMTIISLRMPWIHTPETFERQITPLWANPAAGASNLWSYIDARDVGLACRLSLEADLRGHEAFFIAAEDTFMPIPTADLLRAHYPHTELRPGLEGRASVLSSARAKAQIGYIPRFNWGMYELERPLQP